MQHSPAALMPWQTSKVRNMLGMAEVQAGTKLLSGKSNRQAVAGLRSAPEADGLRLHSKSAGGPVAGQSERLPVRRYSSRKDERTTS